MAKDYKPYAYFNCASFMEDFNIREAGRELEKVLKTELGTGSAIKLTIDVLIPEYLRGDKQGFYTSIIQICNYLNRYIINLNIDIELLKVGQYTSEVRLNVDIRGSHRDKQVILAFINLRQDHIHRLLEILPYPTRFSHGDLWLYFSFSVTFQYSSRAESFPDIFRNKKILLVEKNELSALIFITFMEEWGCRVTKISDGIPAVEEVRHTHYHIALMNIHSQEMQGIQAIREIRKFDQQIPIIGLSSRWVKDDTSPAYEAGANAILAKPVSSDELKKIISRFL